jgi:hypothetical protein
VRPYIQSNGIWTVHDWDDEDLEFSIVNGMIEPDVFTELKFRMEPMETQSYEQAVCYLDQSNVQLIKEVMPYHYYEGIFMSHHADYTYEVFLQAASLYPKFCGEFIQAGTFSYNYDSASKACRRELATLFAHIAYDSATEEGLASGVDSWRYGLSQIEDSVCAGESSSNTDCLFNDVRADLYPPTAGKMYYKRGPLGLKTNELYGKFADAYYHMEFSGADLLLEDPDTLFADPLVAFSSALWRYMTPVDPAPSMHEVAMGHYLPNDVEEDVNITGGFGTTTLILGGMEECGLGDSSMASSQRASNYERLLKVFQLDPEIDTDCADIQAYFPEVGSWGSMASYWDATVINGDVQCKLVTSQSKYSLYSQDDYKKCICKNFGVGETDCIQTISTAGCTSPFCGWESDAFDAAYETATYTVLLMNDWSTDIMTMLFFLGTPKRMHCY